MPLPDFVTHIEDVYHAGLRVQLPRLQTLDGGGRRRRCRTTRGFAELRKEVAQAGRGTRLPTWPTRKKRCSP